MPCEHLPQDAKLILTPELTHHGKWVCACGKFLGWEPKPETKARQAANQSKHRSLLTMRLDAGFETSFIEGLDPFGKLSPKQQFQLDRLAKKYNCT